MKCYAVVTKNKNPVKIHITNEDVRPLSVFEMYMDAVDFVRTSSLGDLEIISIKISEA